MCNLRLGTFVSLLVKRGTAGVQPSLLTQPGIIEIICVSGLTHTRHSVIFRFLLTRAEVIALSKSGYTDGEAVQEGLRKQVQWLSPIPNELGVIRRKEKVS